jgi:hypothetical protein
MAAFGRGEHFRQLRNYGAGHGAERNDGGENPPEAGVAGQVGEEQPTRDEGDDDRNERREPHEIGEGLFEVEVLRAAIE